MVKFIHLSDLHIHSTNRRDNRNCRRIVNFILHYYSEEKPIVLLTGDITDDGAERQYKNAVDILHPLVVGGFKILAVPGNHDYGFAGNVYTEKSQQFFQDYILGELLDNPFASRKEIKMENLYPMTLVEDNVLFIGLDSVVGNENEFLHFASGEVGKAQRQKLAIILKGSSANQKVVVCFHHHPFCRGFLNKFVMEMDDAQKVMRILSGSVNFVCFGHKHEADTWSSENDIDWVLASGKTSRRNEQYKFQYREVEINKNSNKVSTITFM